MRALVLGVGWVVVQHAAYHAPWSSSHGPRAVHAMRAWVVQLLLHVWVVREGVGVLGMREVGVRVGVTRQHGSSHSRGTGLG